MEADREKWVEELKERARQRNEWWDEWKKKWEKDQGKDQGKDQLSEQTVLETISETPWQKQARERKERVCQKKERLRLKKEKKKRQLDPVEKKKDSICRWCIRRGWVLNERGRLHKQIRNRKVRIRFGRDCFYWEERDFYDEAWEVWGRGYYDEISLGKVLRGMKTERWIGGEHGVEQRLKAFRAHLDECLFCEQHPFALCTIGAKLLVRAFEDRLLVEDTRCMWT